MAGGMGGVPPQRQKGNELPTLANPPRVGPKTPANSKPTRVGKWGSRGQGPLARGLGDVLPETENRGRVAHISEPATSGTQEVGEPSANGGGERGSRGRKPPWQGVWGMSPHKTKFKGEQPTPATPPRVGPETPTNPKPTRAGKMLIPHNPVKHQPLSQLAFPSPQML